MRRNRQYIFGAISNLTEREISNWYINQNYYAKIINKLILGLKTELPGIIISNPGASIYSFRFSKITQEIFI